MSQPNKQPNYAQLQHLSLQRQLLLQQQQQQAQTVQNQTQNQLSLQYLPQNLAIQSQSNQLNGATLQLLQQRQQLAAVQQQQYMSKPNYIAQNQINIANLQAQKLYQQKQQQQQQRQQQQQQQVLNRQDNSLQLQKNQNLALTIINELKNVTTSLQQPNLSEIQKQELFKKKSSLEEVIVKIRLIQQQQKEKQMQFQMLQQSRPQQQQQQLANIYQQGLASSSNPNNITQLTQQAQQAQFLSNIANNPALLRQQQQIRLQKQQTSNMINSTNINSIPLQASVSNTSVIPTSSTLSSVTPNLPATSKIAIPLTQTKIEQKASTPTISISNMSSISNEVLNNKSNITVNMSQINNINTSSTPNFAPKSTIATPKQEITISSNLNLKTATISNNNINNLDKLSTKVKTTTETSVSLNATTTASNKKESPIQKQAELLKTQQQQLSPILNKKKESVISSTITKEALNSPYLNKANVNTVASSLITNTPKVTLQKSFSPLGKPTTSIISPANSIKTAKTPTQAPNEISTNIPTKIMTEVKKTQTPTSINNISVPSPLVNLANSRLINNGTNISVVQTAQTTNSLSNNDIKKDSTNFSGQITPTNSINQNFSPIGKPTFDPRLINNKSTPQTNSETTSNKYFSPKINSNLSNSVSSVNSNPSVINQQSLLVKNNIQLDTNKRAPYNNIADIKNNNNNNSMMINNNGLKVLESLKQYGTFTNIIHPKSPFQSTKIFTEVSSTNSITGPALKISGKLLEKRKREEKFHDMVINSNVSTKKRNIKQLVNEVSEKEKLSGYTEQVLFEIADDLIDQMTLFASKIAKHRNSTKIEAKDVQLSLERIWNMKLPGVDIQKNNSKKSNISNIFQQKVNHVRKDMRDRNLLKEMHIQEEQRKQKEIERIEKEKQNTSENATPVATPNTTPKAL
ncbi:hypothetical protein BCR36DRAFT_581787 [Piromyces finnis]|uniref:Transcription initiation factor TFIID subunit 12 domain-containing protein n=1 Tax=Piromyces finnis TaxID=1754191 RepID=A0A1Y1VGD7_9FUNG|nr:hypothetical protein BCR36DRAFT_581787 [Piromyces finnis]|eukprot:ORX54899.1 hypothetical protein BCR36DRAFT_581787 [Piromyces finnis]